MSVSNGQLANATTFNGAFMSRTVDTSTVGTITLNNTSNVNSGAQITNTQRALNEIFNAVGMAGEGDGTRNTYSSNNVVTNGGSRKAAIGELDATFNLVTGHDHDGVNSKAISAAGLSGLNYFTAEWIMIDLVLTAQIEDYDFTSNLVSLFDVSGAAQYTDLGGNLGYFWFNVTDGANTQTDPTGAGTSVQVNVLLADTPSQIATKVKAAIDAASIVGIDTTSVATSILTITYDIGDITPDGGAGTNIFTSFTLVQNGVGVGVASGTSVDVSSAFTAQTPAGNAAAVGVVTDPPLNKVELKNYDSGTYIEDAQGQRVYGRLTEAAGVWTLFFYTVEAGVETVHSLSSQNISMIYREVFNLDTKPTFGLDAGVLATTDMTNDIVPASEAIAGKVLLSNIVATSVGSSNVKGTATRVSHEDHAHQGIHAVQEFTEAVNVFGDIILKGTGKTTVTRSGQTFTINSTTATNDKAEYTLSAGDITNGYIDLTEVALTDSIDFVFYGSGLTSREGVDYTVNYTGGVSSKTRITFSAHTPALVATDVVLIKYQY